MVDWLGISTAPKDGTEFLGYDVRTKKMDVCWFFNGEIQPVQSDGYYGPDETDFGFDRGDIKFWMPLPTAPSSPPTPEPMKGGDAS